MIQQVPQESSDLGDMPTPTRGDDGNVLTYDRQARAYVLKPPPKAERRGGVLSYIAGNPGPARLRDLDDVSGTPSGATNGYAYLYDSALDTFVLREVLTSSTIAGATDFGGTPGPGTDGYAVTWDNGAGEFVFTEMPSGGAEDITDLGDWPATPDARYGQLNSGNKWSGGNKFSQILVAPFYDYPLSHADAQPFDDNAAGAPSGWTQEAAAQAVGTDVFPGFLYLQASSGTGAYSYEFPTDYDDTDFPVWFTTWFTPVLWRDAGYADDVTWWFWVLADDGGSPDEDNYMRIALNWDSAAGQFQIRGEYKISGSETLGSWIPLAQPYTQPLYFRITGRMDAGESDRQRIYVGTSPVPESHTQILGGTSSHGDFDNWHVRISHDRGGGIQSYLYVGGIDFTDDP